MSSSVKEFYDNAQQVIDAGYGNDIDLWMSDLVEEFNWIMWRKTESKSTRGMANARGQTMNREIRRHNEGLSTLFDLDDPPINELFD